VTLEQSSATLLYHICRHAGKDPEGSIENTVCFGEKQLPDLLGVTAAAG